MRLRPFSCIEHNVCQQVRTEPWVSSMSLLGTYGKQETSSNLRPPLGIRKVKCPLSVYFNVLCTMGI